MVIGRQPSIVWRRASSSGTVESDDDPTWRSMKILGRTRVAGVAAADKTDPRLREEHGLIRLAQRGAADGRAAFARLVDTYYDRLYRWLYHLTHDRHTAEDLAQETFLKAFANLGRFHAGTNFRAWLFRIGHNNFVNHHRAAARRGETLPEQLADDEEGPLEQAAHRETLARLAAAIEELPEDFRTAFVLRVDEGLSFREIAGVLNLTEETARWRVFKARQALLPAVSPSLEQETP